MHSALKGIRAATSVGLFAGTLTASAVAGDILSWERGPAIPDREGFAAPFAGVHNGFFLLAGGANFPDKRPWEGGAKTWYSRVMILDTLQGNWKDVGQLPHACAYGISVSTSKGIVCIGGSDATSHYADVIRLQWDGVALTTEVLPRLPKPCANACGALLGNTFYIAGGIEKPDSIAALRTFWSLDLTKINEGWREEKPWDGPGRILATASVHDGSFFLFGGADLKRGEDGKPVRECLRDAFRFKPGTGWSRLVDLPRATVAAPSPAPVVNGKLLILGGDDGSQIQIAPQEHKGFPREILAFDPVTNTWSREGQVPFSLVTTSAVEWNGQIVVPGGEARPGVRSTEFWLGRVERK